VTDPKMAAVQYFHTIILAEWPYEAIYRRLGFRRASTRMTREQQEETEKSIQAAQEIVHLQGAFLRQPVRVEAPERIVLADQGEFQSRNLAAFLRDAREIVLMAATAGEEVMQAIRTDTAEDRITRAVVLDAAASEAVDAALDWMMGYLQQSLRREGKALMNTRYSAGYGDLALENQRMIHRILELERLGVGLTESCILVPEKSVTAMTGILA
jgi:cobalamin-dependent methionine synthase I